MLRASDAGEERLDAIHAELNVNREERLGAKCATIEAAAEEAREQAKADLSQAQAEADRARETSQVKVVELAQEPSKRGPCSPGSMPHCQHCRTVTQKSRSRMH